MVWRAAMDTGCSCPSTCCGLSILDGALHWTTSLGHGRLSGFQELAMLVPFAGVIVLIVFFALDGQAGSNA